MVYGLFFLSLWTGASIAQNSGIDDAIKGNTAFDKGSYEEAEKYYKSVLETEKPTI